MSTEGSGIMRIFPRWARILGLNAEMAGYNLPLGATPQLYRECVQRLAEDRAASGALVTTHKAAIFDHARDLLVGLDENALLCREVSCIVRSPEGLRGLAKDPITAGLALDHLLGSGYWAQWPADAVCIGVGGAGLAIMVRLLTQEDRPRRIVVVDRDAQRLELAGAVARQLGTSADVRFLLHDGVDENDALVSDSPAGSLIINATGMGKDLPGSPISSAARFPLDAVAWDLNYRGELEFLRLAREQSGPRRVRAADGWRYFLHGWTEVIAEVFRLELTPQRFSKLAAAAGDSADALASVPASRVGVIS